MEGNPRVPGGAGDVRGLGASDVPRFWQGLRRSHVQVSRCAAACSWAVTAARSAASWVV